MSAGDPWEDEGYAGPDDWGEESIEADIEEDRTGDDEAGDTEDDPDEAEEDE
jgi:hypothetical protein